MRALKAVDVTFSASADTEMGDYDESPAIIFKAGQLPPPWNEQG